MSKKGGGAPAQPIVTGGDTAPLPIAPGASLGPTGFNLGNFANQFAQAVPQQNPLGAIPGMVPPPQPRMPNQAPQQAQQAPPQAPQQQQAPRPQSAATAHLKAQASAPAPRPPVQQQEAPKATKFESFKKYLEGVASLTTAAGNIKQAFTKPVRASSGGIVKRASSGGLTAASGAGRLTSLGGITPNSVDAGNVSMPSFLKG